MILKPPTQRQLWVYHAWHNGKTLKEIGEMGVPWKIGPERVRQILQKCRHRVRSRIGLPWTTEEGRATKATQIFVDGQSAGA